jgi:hypothetical protein
MLDGTAIGGKRKFALPKVRQWAACIDDGHSPNLIYESTTEVFEMVIQGPSVSKIDEFGAQRKIVFDQASSQGTASERVIFYRGWMDHSNPLSTPRSRTQAPHNLSCTSWGGFRRSTGVETSLLRRITRLHRHANAPGPRACGDSHC